jgi:hypothetical protein
VQAKQAITPALKGRGRIGVFCRPIVPWFLAAIEIQEEID